MVATSRHARKKVLQIVDNVVQSCAIINTSGKRPEETGPERTPQMTTKTDSEIVAERDALIRFIIEFGKKSKPSFRVAAYKKLDELNAVIIARGIKVGA